MAPGGPGVAARCVGTLQAIIGHAKHEGLLKVHPTFGAKRLAGKKKTRRLSIAEIQLIGKAIAYAAANGENPIAIGMLRGLLLTGYRRQAAQAEIVGNPHFFPSTVGDGPCTTVSDCLQRVCGLAGIAGATPHTLRHTFGSVAGDLGFSERTIHAMLGHASQNVTQDCVHIDEALKLAVQRTSDEIERLLALGRESQRQMERVG